MDICMSTWWHNGHTTIMSVNTCVSFYVSLYIQWLQGHQWMTCFSVIHPSSQGCVINVVSVYLLLRYQCPGAEIALLSVLNDFPPLFCLLEEAAANRSFYDRRANKLCSHHTRGLGRHGPGPGIRTYNPTLLFTMTQFRNITIISNLVSWLQWISDCFKMFWKTLG